MRFSTVKLTLFIAAVFLSVSVGSAIAFDDIASDAVIHRAGLKVDWSAHSGASGRGKLVDWHLTVNEDKPTTYFTITATSPGQRTYRENFSEHKISPFGVPYGVDDAVEYCGDRKEVILAEYANDGISDVEVKIDQYTLPESTIYTLTDAGLIKSINADSGKENWSVRVGTFRLQSVGIGASNDHVAVINGSTVYCLEAASGKTLWSRPCRDGVSASPAVSEETIFVPLISGRVEAFTIKDKGINPSAYVSTGLGTTRPLVMEKAIAWATNRGDLNVAGRFGSRAVGYQLRTDQSIVAPPTFKDEIIFATSLDGFIYGLDADRGSIKWQISTGRSISQSPLPLRNFVFAINDDNELYKLDAKTGIEAPGWETPKQNMERFLGAGKENLYILDRTGRLQVLSQNTGQTLSSVPFGTVDKILPNTLSDRLYVATRRGMILSVRETASTIPYYHSKEYVAPVETAPMKAAMENKAVKPEMEKTDLDDPFRVKKSNDGFDENDPFKLKNRDQGKDGFDENDPFKLKNKGGVDEDDPFKQQPEQGDPFGGSSNDADPFSGK